MRKSVPYFLLFLSLTVLPVFADGGADYYPVREGNTWIYTVSAGEEGSPSETMRRIVEERDLSAGESSVRMKHDIPGGEPSYTWLTLDSRGDLVMTSLGSSPGRERAAMVFEPPLTILSHDAPEKGAVWELRLPVPGGTQLAGKSTVESTGETVKVPAGTFRNCLMVKSVSFDETGAEADVTYSWYAKGVGEVRTEQTAPRDRRFKSELKEYTIR